VIRVFEDFDFSRVGQMQSLLEAQGIETFLKNQFGFGGTGELPFVETVPQLFVVHEKDADRARRIISEAQEEPASAATWTCPKCGTEIEGQFSECWNCAEAEDA
jgi:rubrerythrin